MSDLGDDEQTPDRGHRCRPAPTRRGKPRLGDRADCSCGRAFIWVTTPFQQWKPETETYSKILVMRHAKARGPRGQ